MLTVPSPSIAQATGNYDVNRNYGDLFVGDVVVTQMANSTRATVYLDVPSCRDSYSLKGSVTFTYRAPDGGWFTKTISPTTSDVYSVEAPYRMNPQGGRVYISQNLKCKYSGPPIMYSK
jgi:hypothetical protein